MAQRRHHIAAAALPRYALGACSEYRPSGVDVRRRPLLVISVIGVQSSGKSTLMNYLFGCCFATHVGRCTKGQETECGPSVPPIAWDSGLGCMRVRPRVSRLSRVPPAHTHCLCGIHTRERVIDQQNIKWELNRVVRPQSGLKLCEVKATPLRMPMDTLKSLNSSQKTLTNATVGGFWAWGLGPINVVFPQRG